MVEEICAEGDPRRPGWGAGRETRKETTGAGDEASYLCGQREVCPTEEPGATVLVHVRGEGAGVSTPQISPGTG